MTSNDNIGDDEKLLLGAASDGNWLQVLKMYKRKKWLRTVKKTSTGDTVLHMAVSNGELDAVESIVDFVWSMSDELAVDENGDENQYVFGAKNKKGNTPLHLAASASNWSVEMCKEIGGADPSFITRRNNDGETPLFLAALHGNKEAFLWLHYNIPEGTSSRHAPYKRDDNDTILHCAITGGHIDIGIEIVHLYKDHIKDMTMTRNKNGLSPLHILATTPSAFESTDLPSRFVVVQLLYHFLRVKKKKQAKKKQATTMEELEQREWKKYVNGLIIYAKVGDALSNFSIGFTSHLTVLSYRVWSELCNWDRCPTNCLILIGFPLMVLAWVLVLLLKILKIFISAAIWPWNKFRNWFPGAQKMKEKHVWSLQILEVLLQQTALNEDVSVIKSRTPFQSLLTCPETIEDNEAGPKIVDPPLMIAAKNGVIEMVKKILEFFPSGMNVLDDEGKNIVLLAAENRQTKLYQFLYRHIGDNTAFRQVDKDGNTALHLAAKPGLNLYGQTTTMVEEFKWFQFVKNSVPSELWKIYNKEGKTAEEIFRDSYKEHMTNDRKWLDQTSQACTVASTVVASMAFSNFAGENIKKKNDLSLVALSLSLTSTISFLAILAFRSQSLKFWKYNVPFMLYFAIMTMFGSIVALWISLMFHGQSITTCAILGSPIAILTIVLLPIFIGPTVMSVMSVFNEVPPLTLTPQIPSST